MELCSRVELVCVCVCVCVTQAVLHSEGTVKRASIRKWRTETQLRVRQLSLEVSNLHIVHRTLQIDLSLSLSSILQWYTVSRDWSQQLWATGGIRGDIAWCIASSTSLHRPTTLTGP